MATFWLQDNSPATDSKPTTADGSEYIKKLRIHWNFNSQLCLKIYTLYLICSFQWCRLLCTTVGTLIVATIYLQLIQN